MAWIWGIAALLPLLSFAVLALAGDLPGRRAGWIATAAITGSLTLSLVGMGIFLDHFPTSLSPPETFEEEVAYPAAYDRTSPVLTHVSYAWATIVPENPSLRTPASIRVGIYVDSVTALLFVLVTLVSTAVHVYSTAYMAHDPRYPRFFRLLGLFSASMLGLVLADNYLQLFMCWELVGFCSYLLIGYYFERPAAANAANKAFWVNRIGDFGFMVALMILFAHVGSFDFGEVTQSLRDPSGTWRPADERPMGNLALFALGLGILAGCVGKSAQFPLYIWLPDAMEGPTPVSALIHAATMVAAGVFLLARAYPLLSPEILWLTAATGAVTLTVAACLAVLANDIKRILAYSTVSQLGFMVLGLGLGSWVGALAHLVTHGFFKALLFLSAGSVIEGTHRQDIRELGGLGRSMPWTAGWMLMGTLALAAFPPFSGMYSKDLIVAQAMAHAHLVPGDAWLAVLPILAAGLTAFYIVRLWLRLFTGPAPTGQTACKSAHESPVAMLLPMGVLGVLSLVSAGVPGWHGLLYFLDFGRPAATLTPEALRWEHEAHHLHSLAETYALVSALVGAGLATLIVAVERYRAGRPARDPGVLEPPSAVLTALFGAVRWFNDRILEGLARVLAFGAHAFGVLAANIDARMVDRTVLNIAETAWGLGGAVRRFQRGSARAYVLYVAAGTLGILILVAQWI